MMVNIKNILLPFVICGSYLYAMEQRNYVSQAMREALVDRLAEDILPFPYEKSYQFTVLADHGKGYSVYTIWKNEDRIEGTRFDTDPIDCSDCKPLTPKAASLLWKCCETISKLKIILQRII